MNILHVTPLYHPSIGGGERHIQDLSERLVARGHQVTVVTANVASETDHRAGIAGRLPAEEIIRGVHVRRFCPTQDQPAQWLRAWLARKGGYSTARRLFHEASWEKLFQPPMTLALALYIARTPYDVVGAINWSFPQPFHTYLARRVRRFRFVGIPLFHVCEEWAHDPVHAVMLPWCDAVAVNTGAEGDFAQQRGARRVAVIGSGVEPAPFQHRDGAQVRARYGLGRAPVVGFIGRQAANKGVVLLVEAMRAVWAWNPDVRLVLAGHRPPGTDEADAAIADIAGRYKDRIIRIHAFPEEDKPSLHDAFDVYAMPSVSESFGISYLEAWLCKKPVIAADTAQMRCVIDHGTDGLLTEPNRAESVASALITLLRNPEQRRRMGEAGYAKTLAHHTCDHVTDRLEALYRSLHAR